MEVLITKKNLVLDATIFSTLMSCGRLTDYRFNHSLVPINGKGNSLSAGILIHKILEVYNRSVIDGSSRPAAISFGMNAGEEYYKSADCENVPDENIMEYGRIKQVGYSHIVDTMQRYFDYYRNDSWTPLETEQVKGKIIYEDDEIRLLWKAKLDSRMDTFHGIIPMDHKTMKQRREILSLNNQFMGQCVLSDSRTICINKIGFQTSLKPEERFIRSLISYTAERLIEWTQIAGYWAKVYMNYNESGYWPPNFTHCDKFGGCIMRGICESDPSMREEELRLKFKVAEKWDVNNEEE